MAREPKPDFERYMTALNCQEPDRVPLGEWHVDAMPMESFLGRKIKTLQDKIEFCTKPFCVSLNTPAWERFSTRMISPITPAC